MNKRLVKNLKIQGYCNMPDHEMENLGFGNRLAYILCLSLFTYGFITANLYVLIAMNLIAFGGVILPYHPFDYLYNHIVRYWVSKPKLPKRSVQLKFACSMATVMIAMVIYFYSESMILAAHITGCTLMIVASLVSFLDICIPSLIFNYIFKYKIPE